MDTEPEQVDQFVFRFPLVPPAPRDQFTEPADADAALVDFTAGQLRALLSYVTLHECGRSLNPDAFEITTMPGTLVPLEIGER